MLTTTVKTGEQIPDFLHNHRLLPPGSRIKHGGYAYQVEAPGVFNLTDGNARANSSGFDPYLWTYPFRLNSLPTEDQLELPDYDEETLLWRIRDAALAAAERSGVRMPPVLKMVHAIGATSPRFRLGEVVSNLNDISHLPDKAVLYCGDPSTAGRFTVYRIRDNRMEPVLGVMASRPAGAPVVLYEAKGIDAPPSVPVPGDKVSVAKLALKAWRIGKSFKQSQGWCGVFEETLTMLGIDESVAKIAGESSRGVGETLTKEQVADLPVGTLLAWRWERSNGIDHAFGVYERVEQHVRNVSGTRRIFGYGDSERNNHQQMQIIKMPDTETRWTVSGAVMRRCPPGVRFHPNHEPENAMVMTDTPIMIENWRYYVITSWPVTP